MTAFRFVGVGGTAVINAEEAHSALIRITKKVEYVDGTAVPLDAESCRILILTEEVADWLGEELIEWQMNGRYPLIVELPGLSGRLAGRKTLVDSIREAIGIHV